jgi:hypothetical protein
VLIRQTVTADCTAALNQKELTCKIVVDWAQQNARIEQIGVRKAGCVGNVGCTLIASFLHHWASVAGRQQSSGVASLRMS